ncbi:hypothetical protein E2C01_093582 [Portunus trituberculatus]|uniref:Uncharacterized protein n=1 Tax=Portunus trituberculatus TaxID=210409 RepID=A0A5B7K0U7_PORTR|nr:hypothetical protein [Portunus trituberculatus]
MTRQHEAGQGKDQLYRTSLPPQPQGLSSRPHSLHPQHGPIPFSVQ